MLQGDRQKRLWNGALAAPSHARVRIIHRSNSRTYPICSLRPVPDLPAGRFLHKMAIGPKHERWRRRPPASLQAGQRGATTGFAPPVTAQRWTCIDHGAAEGALPAANIDDFHVCLRWIRGSRIRVSHAQKRSVRPSPPVSDRPTCSRFSASTARQVASPACRSRTCVLRPPRGSSCRDCCHPASR